LGPISRHAWKWLAACAVLVLVLGWLVHAQLASRAFDWNVAAASLAHLDWRWLLLSVVFIQATYYGRALRWAVFLKPLKPDTSVLRLFSATVIGFTALTLFGRAGELVRPYLIARKERVPVASQLATLLLERIFDLLMALLVFAFALVRVHASGVRVGARLAWALEAGGSTVGFLTVAVLAAILSMRHFAEPLRRRMLKALGFLPEPRFTKIAGLLASFVQGVESTRSDAALLLVFLYSVAEWLLIAACYWCVARSFHAVLHLSLMDVLIFMGFVSFGAAVQIPGVGGGIQVVAVVVLTELFQVRLEVAGAFAVFIWFLTFVAVVPVGLCLSVKEGLDWRSLRRMGKAAAS